MSHIARCLSHVIRFRNSPWRTDLGYLDAVRPGILHGLIDAILRQQPMYKSELEARLCEMLPSMRRDQIRWLLDFRFGCTRRQLLHSRKSA